MNINTEFYNYIKPYLIKLREKLGDDFVVFGSAPLYLLGVVDFSGQIHDLDINLLDTSLVPPEAKLVSFHKNLEQKFYKIMIDDLEIDIGLYWPGYGDLMDRIRLNPIVIEGFKFANLDIVEDWKKEMVKRYNRDKDKDYLLKIAQFRKK